MFWHFHSTTVGDIYFIPLPEWKYRKCLLLWWSGNTEHVSYCGGVEIQNVYPTVVEWNKVDVTYCGGVKMPKHVSCCGGVEIQNMSPTVVE
jgi:hypothetical protein